MLLSKLNYQMVNIKSKPQTNRIAIAVGSIVVGEHAFSLIQKNEMPKGNPLVLAEVSGIQGAKLAHQMIPLCHPLNLNHVAIYTSLQAEENMVTVYCKACATAPTGVEMEALAGVNAALLTIYDVTKMIEPALKIANIRLVYKRGGKSHEWIHPEGIPKEISHLIENRETDHQLRASVIKISDRAAEGEYTDTKFLIDEMLKSMKQIGFNILSFEIIPNEADKIKEKVNHLIQVHSPDLLITTGGTGLSARDTTPDVIAPLCDRLIPGLSELLRTEGAKYNSFAYLSRCIAGLIKNTLIITLPGKPKAVHESLDILKHILAHALQTLREKPHDQVQGFN